MPRNVTSTVFHPAIDNSYLHNYSFIGIDPGFTGAAAILHNNGSLIELVDAPTHMVSFVKNGKRCERPEFITEEMVKLFKYYRPAVAVIELVTAFSKQGVTSMFRFGHGLGLWEGVLAGLEIPCAKVPSVTWKRARGLLKASKEQTLEHARTTFPDAISLLSRKKDHGRADALYIAAFGRGLLLDNLENKA